MPTRGSSPVVGERSRLLSARELSRSRDRRPAHRPGAQSRRPQARLEGWRRRQRSRGGRRGAARRIEQVVAPGDGVAHRLLAVRQIARPAASRSSRRSKRSSRASSACGGSRRARAAASSIASGKPSSRSQISITGAALSAVRANSGLTARARSTKRRTASDSSNSSRRRTPVSSREAPPRARQPQRGQRQLLLAAQVEPLAAGDQDRQLRAASASRSATTAAAAHHLLEVVEHEQ